MTTAYQSLQQGIAALRAGQHEEGERLVRLALRDPAIKGRLRATAFNWLAEVAATNEEKIAHYDNALLADPDNDLAEQRLAELLRPPRQQPPPPDELPEMGTPPPPDKLPEERNPLVPPAPPAPVFSQQTVPRNQSTQPTIQQPPRMPEETIPARHALPTAQQRHSVVGILDGPNGRGSGFFLTNTGIIATTRHVIGARESMTVEVEPGRQATARVLRSFPDMDVALLYLEQGGGTVLPAIPADNIPDNTRLLVMSYQAQRVQGRRRETGRTLAPHLFPTDILQIPDAGGAPVLNEQQVVVGMITRNTSSSSAYLYGVHIAVVQRCFSTYNYELQQVAQRVYCTSCGYASAAATIGGFYCEMCGTVMPHAQNQRRVQTPQMAASFYGENSPYACRHCGSKAGFYDGVCLRCGHAGDTNQPLPY